MADNLYKGDDKILINEVETGDIADEAVTRGKLADDQQVPSLTGQAGKALLANQSEDALEFGEAGGAVTDDAVLDLAKETRVAGDRGKYLGVSATNENELALLEPVSTGTVAVPSDKTFSLAAASGTNVNRKTIGASTGRVALSDYQSLVFVADSDAGDIGVTATTGGLAFAETGAYIIEGSFEFDANTGGGASRLYSEIRGSLTRGAATTNPANLRSPTWYNKTAADAQNLEQGPPRMHGEFLWLFEAQAGDTIAFDWRAYIQTSTQVDIIADMSNVVVRKIVGAKGDKGDKGDPGGVTAFTGLSDTPANYTGQGGKVVQVNSAATALEFTDAASGGVGVQTVKRTTNLSVRVTGTYDGRNTTGRIADETVLTITPNRTVGSVLIGYNVVITRHTFSTPLTVELVRTRSGSDTTINSFTTDQSGLSFYAFTVDTAQTGDTYKVVMSSRQGVHSGNNPVVVTVLTGSSFFVIG